MDLMFIVSSPGGFASFTLINTEVPAGTPVPDGATGAWVLLIGQGATGLTGTTATGSSANGNGGRGGGGGARVGWGFVPVSAMGSTYSLTYGTSGSSFATFISGGVTLSAGWGRTSLGGIASQTGISGLPMEDGGDGGTGGFGGTSSGGPGGSTTNGAGAGGGGGGGYTTSGANHGTPGGAGGTSTGGVGFTFATQGGGHGAGGHGTATSATGGVGGGGGGAGGYAGGTGGPTNQAPGGGYIRIQWV